MQSRPQHANRSLSQFFAANMVDFSQVQYTSNNKIRYNQERQQGKVLTKSSDLRQRQQVLFMERQAQARQHQLSQVRKYRIGELPDIQIKFSDIILPLIELTFVDEELSGETFVLLLNELFKEEESEQRKTELKLILTNLMQKSLQFNFTFVSTMQKTMLKLCQRGELFSSELIRRTGLKR